MEINSCHTDAMIHSHIESLECVRQNMEHLTDRVSKLEDKYDTILELTSEIRVLSEQIKNMAGSVETLRDDMKTNINDIVEEQKTICTKVDKLESSTMPAVDRVNTGKELGIEILKVILQNVVTIILVIVLIALFPHLSDIIK